MGLESTAAPTGCAKVLPGTLRGRSSPTANSKYACDGMHTACKKATCSILDRTCTLQVFEEDTKKGDGLSNEMAQELYEFMKLLKSHSADDQSMVKNTHVACRLHSLI